MSPLVWWVLLVLFDSVSLLWFGLGLSVLVTSNKYLVNYSGGQMIFAVFGILSGPAALILTGKSTFEGGPAELGITVTVLMIVFLLFFGHRGWKYGARDPHWR